MSILDLVIICDGI